MSVLAVDLAAKLSAACVMSSDHTVLAQFDSFGRTEDEFLSELVDCFDYYRDSEHGLSHLVVEDLPHGLTYSTLIKTVCRLQGRIYQLMAADGDDVVFVAPNTWRAHYPAARRGTGSDITVPIAATFGYTPPPGLPERTKGRGGKTRARKIATDYCAAYLIARWAIDSLRDFDSLDVPGTSRYNTDVIRKKDFDAENSSRG